MTSYSEKILELISLSAFNSDSRLKLDAIKPDKVLYKICRLDNNSFTDCVHKLAEQQNSYALWYLGIMYAEGYDVEPDNAKAVLALEKSASLGNINAMLSLADFYEEFSSAEKQFKANDWLFDASKLGNTTAMVRLGTKYSGNRHDEGDMKTALELFTKAWELGDSAGAYHLAEMYELGNELFNGDIPKSIEFYKKAADKGNIDAICTLADFYVEGHILDQNFETAQTLFEQAAEQGDYGAKFKLAEMYYRGTGMKEPNYAKAFKMLDELYKRYSQYQVAMYIGEMYRSGLGVKQNYRMAFNYFLEYSNRKEILATIRMIVQKNLSFKDSVLLSTDLAKCIRGDKELQAQKVELLCQCAITLQEVLEAREILPLEIIIIIGNRLMDISR